MKDLNTPGVIAGLVAWISINLYAVSQSECLRSNSCGGDDLMISAAIGVGLLAPAWIVALIFSGLFGSDE